MRAFRPLVLLAATALGAGALSACSSSDGSESSASSAASGTSSSSTGGAGDGGFPATVKTAGGDVTVQKKPTRVVTLDSPSLDAATSLGVPVATAMSGSLKPGQPEPWLKDAYSGSYDSSLINKDFTPNVEKIASHRPDLILSGTVQMKPETLKQLSAVAPVVGDVTTNDDWDARLTQIGTATGSAGKVDGIQKQVRQAYSSTGLNLKGKTYQWMRFDGSSNSFASGNGSWLELFGLKPGTKQDNTMESRSAFSLENLDQLNADVVYVWNNGGDPKRIESDPRFKSLPSVKRGTFFWTKPDLAFSVNVAGPHALKYAAGQTASALKKAEDR